MALTFKKNISLICTYVNNYRTRKYFFQCYNQYQQSSAEALRKKKINFLMK